MEMARAQKDDVVGFFKEKGLDEPLILEMFRQCRALESIKTETIGDIWSYLKNVGVQEKKLPVVVTICPKILALSLDDKIIPTVNCLASLQTEAGQVAEAITHFPSILAHNIEEKLCPLLAFFQALGIPHKAAGKLVLKNPRLIKFGIDTELSEFVDFMVNLGLSQATMVGSILVKHPSVVVYNVEIQLRPASNFLKSIGINEFDMRKVVMKHPEVLSRDVERVLRSNLVFLKSCGFNDKQITTLVAGYPLVLVKNAKNSLAPAIRFLVDVMGRGIGEIVDYPQFLRHGKKSLEFRYKLLKGKDVSCSLMEMLDCNLHQFKATYGLC